MEKIIERKVFDASIRNEMVGFRFELEEESQEISVLKTIYESVLVLLQFSWRYSSKCHQILQRTRAKCNIIGNKGSRQYDTILEARKANNYKQHSSWTEWQAKGWATAIGRYVLQNLFKKHCRVNSDESLPNKPRLSLRLAKLKILPRKNWYQIWTEGDLIEDGKLCQTIHC